MLAALPRVARRPTTRSRWSSRRPARPGARSGCCCRAPRCAPRSRATERAARRPGPVGARAAADVRRRAAGAAAARWSPGTSRSCSTTVARGGSAGSRRAPATSRSCRPSCTGCSTDGDARRAARASTRCCVGGGPLDPALRDRAADAGRPRGGDVRDGGDLRRLRVRRRAARRGRRCGSAPSGRIRLAGPMLFDGYDGDPELTAEVLRGRLVPHLRLGRARRRRPAARARPGRRRRRQRRRQRAGCRRSAARLRAAPGRRGGRGASASPTTEWGSGWSPFVVGDRVDLDEAARLGRGARRAPGRRASSCVLDAAAAAGERQGRPGRAARGSRHG